MKARKKRWGVALIILAASLALLPVSRAAAQQGPVLVGRISFIQGELLRYVPEIKDWVLVRQNSPFGFNDALYSGDSAKAEFIFPNGLLVRINGGAQIQLIALKEDATEMDLGSGVARFYNRNPDGMLKVTTPYGYVLAQPESIFDVYVGDSSVEVIDLNGRVDYIEQSDNSSYELTPGGPSIIADDNQVSNGEGAVDAAWDEWNSERDSLLAERMAAERNSESWRRLPPKLDSYAWDLNRYGRWDRVLYNGEYHDFWRPTSVPADWQPFTEGRWTDYYGDQVWVPDEPFGYVTCHYGNWLLINGGWYWAPPAPMGASPYGPHIAFGWYPGRVAWIGTGREIGWIPLSPHERYYAHHHWGSGAVVVRAASVPSIAIAGLAFAAAAVIVPHRDFYSVTNYRSVRIRHIDRSQIINRFHAAPVVNKTVFRDYRRTTARYNFVNKAPALKPYVAVDRRIIRNNRTVDTAARRLSAPALRQTAASVRRAKPGRQGAVKPPARLTSKLVPASQTNAPKNSVKFKTLSMKKRTRPAKSSSAARPAAARAPARRVAPPQRPATRPAPGVKHPPLERPATPRPGMHPATPPPGMHPPKAPPAFPKLPGHPPITRPATPPPRMRPPTPPPRIRPPAARPAPNRPAARRPAARPAPNRPAARPAPNRPAVRRPAPAARHPRQPEKGKHPEQKR